MGQSRYPYEDVQALALELECLCLDKCSSSSWFPKNELRVNNVTYASSFKSSCLRIALIHDHGIWIGAGGDDHRCISASSLDSAIMHNVLGEILPKAKTVR